jgi:hypothetical protein
MRQYELDSGKVEQVNEPSRFITFLGNHGVTKRLVIINDSRLLPLQKRLPGLHLIYCIYRVRKGARK